MYGMFEVRYRRDSMAQPIVTIKDQKQQVQMTIERMIVYKQCKLIDGHDEEGNRYYMFFYKQKYLNTVKAKPLQDDSYARKALENGITFPAPHPLIEATICDTDVYKKHRFNDLFPKLKKQLQYDEIVLIATFFDAFIKSEQLLKFIKTLFYENRRNGKLYACYRIYRIVANFAPSHSWVRSLASTLEFKQYDLMYREINTTLKEKDPLYYEHVLFENLKEDQSFQQLSQFLQEQNRWIDETAALIHKFEATPSEEWYFQVHHKIQSRFENENMIRILEDLCERVSELETLQYDLLDLYLSMDRPVNALELLASTNLTLGEKQLQAFDQLVGQIDIEKSSVIIEEFNKVLSSLFTQIPAHTKSLLHNSLEILMKEHSLDYIQEWLQPLRDCPEANHMIHKIDRMLEIRDEPNLQMELGEFFYEFGQYDQAIECFSWEMELHDHNPKPVQWLSKIYNEIGMRDEAKAYQKLYVDMVNA